MKLLQPIKIQNLEIKNRMVVSAMVTNYCQENGLPTEKWMRYHEEKAKGGWGLIITEDFCIAPKVGGFVCLPGLWEDSQIPAYQNFTDRIHRAGGKIAAQIYHAGRETCSAITGIPNVAPSAIHDPTIDEIPQELTVAEIKELVETFAACALRVKEAGFDAVEVHGAHGYLINQFLSPFSNKRHDEYGGTIARRAKFAVDIVKRIKELCGSDYPVIFRMSVQEYVEGGLKIADSCVLAQLLEQAGVDCLHCSQGVYVSEHTIIPPSCFPVAGYIENAAAIKQAVSIPVIAAGRINDPYLAETILSRGQADLCTMARASLADPHMPEKVMHGEYEEINHCIGCVQGCLGENARGRSVRCLVNPRTGMEYTYEVTPVETPKKVLVVGGGVAGCEAAIVAAQRGHHVILCEKTDKLGGQWIPASVPIGKAEFAGFLVWQETMLKKHQVEIKRNCNVNGALVQEIAPDVVIDATGSVPFIPGIPGLKEHCVTAHDVLNGVVKPGHKVAVIGGGLVGSETADHLAQHGYEVSVFEMRDRIAIDGENGSVYYMKKRMADKNVAIYTDAAVSEVKADAVVYREDGREFVLEGVDTVISAVGSRSCGVLAVELKELSVPVITIGDAKKARNGFVAIQEGYEAGLTV